MRLEHDGRAEACTRALHGVLQRFKGGILDRPDRQREVAAVLWRPQGERVDHLPACIAQHTAMTVRAAQLRLREAFHAFLPAAVDADEATGTSRFR